jgi:hypothetical protein
MPYAPNGSNWNKPNYMDIESMLKTESNNFLIMT